MAWTKCQEIAILSDLELGKGKWKQIYSCLDLQIISSDPAWRNQCINVNQKQKTRL